MKKLLIASAIVAAVSAPSAFSQSAFEGAYGQIGIGYESVAPSFSGGQVYGTGYRANYSISSSNANSFTGNVGIGYTFLLAPQFTLGLGAEYSPIESSSTNATISIPSLRSSSTVSWKKTNSYNIFLAPGYAIDKDKLAYVKVGYSGATISADGDTNFNGYSVGIGYKQIISSAWYGFAEVNYSSYGNQNIGGGGINGTYNFNSTNALVGVGYKF